MEAQPVSEKRALLKSVFGYEGFRPGQEQLIDALLQGRDAMGIMPTGAGKSMCYQLPALLLPGITLVVSPLISLMKDQVNALVQSGVRAAYLNSSLTEGQTAKAIANAMEGVYKIIYVAPERLFTPRFQNFAQGMNISMVCVDEAHCVSQWGQDFRPGYLDIARFLETLPRRPVVGAFTATATGEVREDIVRLLGLADPVTVVTGFDRPNLYFGVEEPRDKYAAVTRYLAAHTGASGIVYCLTRKTVEEVCEKLRADGYAATRYHAGLSADERQRNQDAFLYDEARVMVATNAFGMGIDKSNVSFVLHYNMPKNIESYYQEAGRAGRDGQPADCILLYGGKDVVTNRFFIEKDDENDALDEETRRLVREKDEERLRRMTFYCHSGSCLRAYLLRYFGENAPEHCDNCSVCSTQTEKVDVSGEARIIFLFLRDLRYPLGAATVIDALRGSESERVLRHRLERADGYGRLRSVSAARLRAIFNHLTAAGYLEQAAGQYPTLSLGAPALEFLEYGGTVTLRVAREAPRAHESTAALPADMALFERMAGTRGMADAALAAMGLEDARRTPLRRLTPAQRRRLSIAREIVRAPEVFYIEEPLAGQDAEGCRRILEWMDGVPSTGRRCIEATASTRTVYLLPGERYHLDGNGLERLEAAEESAAQGTAVEKIPAKAGETLLLFNPSDIDFAESASGRTALSVRGEEYACALTLEELSARLERYGFFRCHRSYLVNMQKVQEVVRWTRNSYALRLENGPESGVPLSKGRIDAMRRQYRF